MTRNPFRLPPKTRMPHHIVPATKQTDSAGGAGTLPGSVDRTIIVTTGPGALRHDDLAGVTTGQHHAEDHVLATDVALGAHHTMSGGVVGWVLRATGAATAKFMQLLHSDLGGVTANQHHNEAHAAAAPGVHTFPGDATKFLDGSGAFSTPAGGGGSGEVTYASLAKFGVD